MRGFSFFFDEKRKQSVKRLSCFSPLLFRGNNATTHSSFLHFFTWAFFFCDRGVRNGEEKCAKETKPQRESEEKRKQKVIIKAKRREHRHHHRSQQQQRERRERFGSAWLCTTFTAKITLIAYYRLNSYNSYDHF